jgi:hypothetical protein
VAGAAEDLNLLDPKAAVLAAAAGEPTPPAVLRCNLQAAVADLATTAECQEVTISGDKVQGAVVVVQVPLVVEAVRVLLQEATGVSAVHMIFPELQLTMQAVAALKETLQAELAVSVVVATGVSLQGQVPTVQQIPVEAVEAEETLLPAVLVDQVLLLFNI